MTEWDVCIYLCLQCDGYGACVKGKLIMVEGYCDNYMMNHNFMEKVGDPRFLFLKFTHVC